MVFRIIILNYIWNCMSNSYRKVFQKWAVLPVTWYQLPQTRPLVLTQGSPWRQDPPAPFRTACPSTWRKSIIRKTNFHSCEQRSRLYKWVLKPHVMRDCSQLGSGGRDGIPGDDGGGGVEGGCPRCLVLERKESAFRASTHWTSHSRLSRGRLFTYWLVQVLSAPKEHF